ncbi:MAG: SAM-dependent methyltransferase [Burkholderiales bacterium]|nr:SAM-dependent methyltransferase [Burkholderiales bacterium]
MPSLPGYEVDTVTYCIGGNDYHIRALRNRQQYADPDGAAERAGVSPASWPLFGVVWPAGLALAEAMSGFPIAGKHILELGCGIALTSLVLARRGADITACDYHPLAAEFLRYNTELNGLPPMTFHNAPWLGPNPLLGRYDLIIGSDLLYERGHAALLAGFISHHANPAAQVLLADPGRGYVSSFSALMAAQGYVRSSQSMPMADSLGMPSSRGRMFGFLRAAAPGSDDSNHDAALSI